MTFKKILLILSIIFLTGCNQFDKNQKSLNYFIDKYDCDTIDGIRIKYSHGWALVRSSNTQPVIVFRFESNSVDNLEKIKNEVFGKLKEFGDFEFNGF